MQPRLGIAVLLVLGGMALPLRSEPVAPAAAQEKSAPAEPKSVQPVSTPAPAEEKKSPPVEEKSPASAVDSAPAPQKTEAEPQKTEETPAPKKAAEAPAALETVGCVTPLKDVLAAYDRESGSLKKLMARWNAKMKAAVQQETSIKAEIDSTNKEIASKQDSTSKQDKKEAGRLKGRVERMSKELKIVRKENSQLCRELAAELREISKESLNNLKMRFQETGKTIENSGKEKD